MSITIQSDSQAMGTARCLSCSSADDLFNIKIGANGPERTHFQFHLCRDCLYEFVQAAKEAMHGLLDTPTYVIAKGVDSRLTIEECWFSRRDGDDIVLATAPQSDGTQRSFRYHYQEKEKFIFGTRADAELAMLDLLGIQADCGDDKQFPKLREALFQAGHEVIADFLGYKYPKGEAKETTERRLNGARLRMSRAAFEHWAKSYNVV